MGFLSKGKENFFVILILLVSFLLRILGLDQLPNEQWGDVNEHLDMAQEILDGKPFWSFRFGGDGPIFSYVLAYVSLFFGLDFWTAKLTTVLIGTLTTLLIYLLAKAVTKKTVASLAAMWWMAVAFWPLTFSRQAKPHILVAFFTTCVLLVLVKKKWWWLGGLSVLGVFSQAGFWCLGLLCLRQWKASILMLVVGAIFILRISGAYREASFFTEKMGGDFTITERVTLMSANALESTWALFGVGDETFRHTIPNQSHLDNISKMMVLIGMIMTSWTAIVRRKWEYLWIFFIPFGLAQVPAIADIANPHSLPNMGRTIGLLPVLALWFGIGTEKVLSFFKSQKNLLSALFSIFFCTLILNVHAYFIRYPRVLPNYNTSFSKTIVRSAKTSYRKLPIVIVGCCWGQGQQPEPNSLRWTYGRGLDSQIIFDETMTIAYPAMSDLLPRHFFVLTDPYNVQLHTELSTHYSVQSSEYVVSDGWAVAKVFEVLNEKK